MLAATATEIFVGDSMASVNLYNAVKGLLATLATPLKVLDFDQIEPQLEQGTNSFLVLEEVYSDEELVSIGDPSAVCVRESASLLIHAFVPAPESSTVARTLADTVRKQLSYQRPGGARVLSASPPTLEVLNDGLWTAALIDVEAEFDRRISLP